MMKEYKTPSGVPYTIVRAGRKTLGITIDREGKVEVRIPRWVTVAEAESFVEEKDDWINRSIEKQKVKKETSEAWNWDKLKTETLPWIRGKGGEIFGRKVSDWAEKMGVTYEKVNIRDTSSRWGSCSNKGNLAFSWKIFVMREELVDYLIVHELAHRKHMDHSPAFWAEVERFIPDYKLLKKELNLYV